MLIRLPTVTRSRHQNSQTNSANAAALPRDAGERARGMDGGTKEWHSPAEGGGGGLQIRLTGRLKREKESLCGRVKGSETEKEIGRERREGTREH